MPKIIHNGVEYGGGGYSKKQIDDKLRLKLDKSSVDAVLSSDSVKPVQNKVVTKALIDKVSQVKVMPASDFDGVAVLYTGDTTTEYTQGHVYQYNETDGSWIDITDVLDVIKNVESLPTANIEDMFYRVGGGVWANKTITLSLNADDVKEQLCAIGYLVVTDTNTASGRDITFNSLGNQGYQKGETLYHVTSIQATWSDDKYVMIANAIEGHVTIATMATEDIENTNFRTLEQNELWAGDSETQTIRRVAWNDEVTIQYEIMPTPSENEFGKIVQYVGETTGNYIKGFFYRCAEVPDTDPTEYEWVHQNVDEISGDAVVWVTDFPTAPDIKNVVYGKITTTTEYVNEKTVGLDSLDTETRITLDGDNYIPASTNDVYVKGGDVSDYEVFVSFNTTTNELTTSEGTYTLETETELTFATQTTTETKSFRIGNEERQELTELESGGTEVIANPSETATDTLSKVSIDGTVYEVGGEAIQVETLPTASASEVGNIYQYVGETDVYTKGYFYECVSDEQEPPTYSWKSLLNISGSIKDVSELPTSSIENIIYRLDNLLEYNIDYTTETMSWAKADEYLQSFSDFLTEHGIEHTTKYRGNTDNVPAANITNPEIFLRTENLAIKNKPLSRVVFYNADTAFGHTLGVRTFDGNTLYFKDKEIFTIYKGTNNTLYAGSEKNQTVERLANYEDIPDVSKIPNTFTGTQEEWDALTENEKVEYDIANITDDNSGLEMPVEIYSTTETKTNKIWIDGRPIYRKVFTELSITLKETTWVSTGLSVEYVDSILTARALNNTDSIPLNTRIQSNILSIYLYGMNGYAVNTIILEYTKTTD